MRLASIQHEQGTRWGMVKGDRIRLAPATGGWPDSMIALITMPSPTRAALLEALAGDSDATELPLNNQSLLAPIPEPRRNVICLGLNYANHARESMAAKGKALELPSDPVVFTKATNAVTGPFAPIPLDPDISTELDWEVELGVVIGQRCYKVSPAQALAHVFGYTVVNDISARDVQFRHKQFFLGKSLNGTCPTGPWIVTTDEITDPQALSIRCLVNGTLKQDGHTSDMIFGVAEAVSRLSHVLPLEPGDLIATGTPEGVGFARTPPEFLHDGDTVTCEIDGIGRISNPVQRVT